MSSEDQRSRSDTTVATTSYKDGGQGRNKAQKRLLLWRRQNRLCAVCGRPMALSDTTLDHIIPKAKGGPNTYANLRVAHRECNAARAASLDDVFIDVIGLRALRWNVKELP